MVAEATKMLFLAALVWMVTTKPTMVAAVGAAAAAAARMLKDAKNIHAVPLSLQSGMQQKILQATMFTTSTL
jgi:hypothetical protein